MNGASQRFEHALPVQPADRADVACREEDRGGTKRRDRAEERSRGYPGGETATGWRSWSQWAEAEQVGQMKADALIIAGKTYGSRLLVGTGKYRDFAETRASGHHHLEGRERFIIDNLGGWAGTDWHWLGGIRTRPRRITASPTADGDGSPASRASAPLGRCRSSTNPTTGGKKDKSVDSHGPGLSHVEQRHRLRCGPGLHRRVLLGRRWRNPANGHYYEAVFDPGITWVEAWKAAEQKRHQEQYEPEPVDAHKKSETYCSLRRGRNRAREHSRVARGRRRRRA